jgi:hypothetical protein
VIVSALDDGDRPAVAAMPAAVPIAATEFSAGAIAMAALDHDFVGAGMVFAATLDNYFLGAGDRGGRNGNRGNRRDNKSKLRHDMLSPPVKVRTEHPTRANVPIGSRENSEQAFRLDGI